MQAQDEQRVCEANTPAQATAGDFPQRRGRSYHTLLSVPSGPSLNIAKLCNVIEMLPIAFVIGSVTSYVELVLRSCLMHRKSLTWYLAVFGSVLTELAVVCSQTQHLHSTVHHLHLPVW